MLKSPSHRNKLYLAAQAASFLLGVAVPLPEGANPRMKRTPKVLPSRRRQKDTAVGQRERRP